MLRTMLTASNTMSQLQNKLDTISNNISNSNTTGYKARSASFSELMYQQFNNDKKDQAPRESQVGIRIGVGAQIAQTKLNTAVGSMTETGRDLDFALTKANQYFTFISPQTGEQLYSRQGNMYLSPNDDGTSNLVNSEGYSVADANGQAITFTKDVAEITASANGNLTVTYADNTTATLDLGIAQIDKPNLLEQDQGNYLRYSDDIATKYPDQNSVVRLINGNERTNIAVQGGALESSNVDLTKEMSELTTAQRSYQMNARTITLSDQMLGLINSVR